MVDINNFHSVFSLGRNSSSLPRNLDAYKLNRGKLGGNLFFDRLLARKHLENGSPFSFLFGLCCVSHVYCVSHLEWPCFC